LLVSAGQDPLGSPGDSTFVVDDDRKQCPNADFTRIQDAVDAAKSGDTIKVCPGNYPERVTVTKTLKLLGAKHGKDGRHRTLSSSGESVVAGARPFILGADDIVLDGFTVLTEPGESGEGSGILTSDDHSGYRIQNNVADADGVTALFPGSNGQARSIARQNHFYSRFGVATSDDEPRAVAHNWLIADNLFTDSSLALSSAEDRNITVSENKFENGRISVESGRHVTIESNAVRTRDSGINIGVKCCGFPPSHDVLVKDNHLRGENASFGIFVFGDNTDVLLKENRISGFSEGGVLLLQTSKVTAEKNEVKNNGTGFELAAASHNRIVKNQVDDNKDLGIFIDPQSTGNLIIDNEARGNDHLQCLDQSSGLGTAGTANIWKHNEGSPSDPIGICVDSP
jgi:parallel beta-helix repeat protein